MECRFTLKCVCNITKIYSQKHHGDKYSQLSSITWPVRLNGWLFLFDLFVSFSQVAVTLNWHFLLVSRKEFLENQVTIVWIHSETSTLHGKNIQSSCCGFLFSCTHLNFRFRTCFDQGFPWHLGNYILSIKLWNAYDKWQEHTVKCTIQISSHESAQLFDQFRLIVECSFTN